MNYLKSKSNLVAYSPTTRISSSFTLKKKAHYVSFFAKLYYLFKTWSPQCLKPGSTSGGGCYPIKESTYKVATKISLS